MKTGRWWKNREEPAGDAGDLERVAQINARAPVPIEVPGTPLPSPASNGASPRVDEAILREEHHHQYGGPWAKGKYRFEFLVESGLRPEHRLCDFGCGALRLGVWTIPYLDAGRYFGIDSHLESLEAAAAYEIPLHALESKQPRLLWSQDFAFSHFGVQFDWVVDFSSSQKVDPPELPRLFGELVAALAPGGSFLTAPRLSAPVEQYTEWGLTLVREIEQDAPTLHGHDFPSATTWWEFTVHK